MDTKVISAMMHPLRVRILQELIRKGEATTKDIQNSCGDCAQATLYRHIRELLKYNLIQVVAENNVNGIVEKVYAIKRNIMQELAEDPGKGSKEDYLNIHMQFMLSILNDMTKSIEGLGDTKDFRKHIGFASSTLLLTDEELHELRKEIGQSIIKRMNNVPSEGRKIRKFSTFVTTTFNT